MEKRTEQGWAKKRQYTKDNFTTIGIGFNKNTEAHIIEYLNSQGNRSAYVKELILQDMKKAQ